MELRLYSFVNFYLSSIQQGIQTGHAAVDLVRKYGEKYLSWIDAITTKKIEMVSDWADDYKTFIILNGGDYSGVLSAGVTIEQSEFPFAFFHESEGALNNLCTCYAVVLPESIFNARVRHPNAELDLKDAEPVYEWTNPDTGGVVPYYPNHKHYKLITLLRSSRLAS